MGYLPDRLRSAAVEVYFEANKDMHKARELFTARFPKHGIARLDMFINHWARAWQQRRSIQSAPKPGRPPVMPDGVARVCANAFKQGRMILGQRRGFSSVRQAVSKSATIKSALALHPISRRCLLKRMRRVDPSLVRRTESVKPALGILLRAKRRRVARKLKGKPLSYFQSVHWIDCKQMYIAPRDRKVWTDAAWGAPTVSDSRVGMNRSKLIRLKFYASVCWATGAACLFFVTGTSPAAFKVKPYKVMQPLLRL